MIFASIKFSLCGRAFNSSVWHFSGIVAVGRARTIMQTRPDDVTVGAEIPYGLFCVRWIRLTVCCRHFRTAASAGFLRRAKQRISIRPNRPCNERLPSN